MYIAVLNVDDDAHFFVYDERSESVQAAVQRAPIGVGSLAVGSTDGLDSAADEGGETIETDVRVSLGVGVEVSWASAVAARAARAYSLIVRYVLRSVSEDSKW